MAQTSEKHSVKELERDDVDQLSMEDLSRESNMQSISSTQWETLYQESQSKLDIILETLAPVVSRLKILEGKQSAVELQQPFEKTQVVKSRRIPSTTRVVGVLRSSGMKRKVLETSWTNWS